jgi:hypothetical protein
LDLIALGDHTLHISLVILLLDAFLFMTGGAGSDGGSGQRATGSAYSGTVAAAQRRAKASTEDSPANAFDQSCIVGAIGLSANLIVGILLAGILF